MFTPSSSTIKRSVAALATAALLVGCSGGSDDDATVVDSTEAAVETTEAVVETTEAVVETTEPVVETTEATDTTEPSEPSAPTGSIPEDVLTEPGAELVVGDTAVVTFDTDLPDEHVALTVEAIRQGTDAELAELQVPDLAAGSTVWYVDYTVTNVSATETGGDYLPSTGHQFGVLADDDSVFVPIIKFVAFEPCENEDAIDLAVGESVTTCDIFVSEDGLDAARVVFTPDFDTLPISWR